VLPKASWVSWVEPSRYQAGTAYATFDRHTFGDLTPWVYRTTDFGKTWTRIVQPNGRVRGYAHVIKEDTQKRDLLFLGTEFGLYVSLDGGRQWAQFRGGDFPAGVAVRDLVVHPRDGDLVLATHGRGIWIVDDLTPLRALSDDVLSRDVALLPDRPAQERMFAVGGWSEGDAMFTGENPPAGAEITWYQRSRHIYGPIQLEVLDADGKVIDSIPASTRRGLNRVTWPMTLPPPRVPRAATVSFSSSRGPRVMPGTYTVRLRKGDKTLEAQLQVGMDRRATYSIDDRRKNYEASLAVVALFGDMSALIDKIDAAEKATAERTGKLPKDDALIPRLTALREKLEGVRRMIVATKEGGAITGEERIREHTDQLYGALIRWEGRPAAYQLARIDALRHELSDVQQAFDQLANGEMRSLLASAR
jgi:hypothetical protein